MPLAELVAKPLDYVSKPVSDRLLNTYTQEATAYKPTLRDRIAGALLPADGQASLARENLVTGLTGSKGIGSTGMGIADVTPLGVPMALQEALRANNAQDAALAIVPMGVALRGAKPVARGADDILKRAVENTPQASINPDGHLVINLERRQKPEQEMSESVRGGVFYLPKGDKNFRHYNNGTGQQGANNYGGTQQIVGETAYTNPLVVKGATGGKSPEMAYTQLLGKDAFKELQKDIDSANVPSYIYNKEPELRVEQVQKFLEKHAPELSNHAEFIIENSAKGNQLRYALQEAAVASAARKAGHDGIVGYGVKRGENSGKPFITEVFDVRENRYPSPSGEYSVHPQFEAKEPVKETKAFLRPALKYGEKLYKGKPGQQHHDIIPSDLYGDYSRKALRGDDMADYNFGFMDHKGRFLSREDALNYAIENGLVNSEMKKMGVLTSDVEIPNWKLTPVDKIP